MDVLRKTVQNEGVRGLYKVRAACLQGVKRGCRKRGG